jgi:hypothetical protein
MDVCPRFFLCCVVLCRYWPVQGILPTVQIDS